MDFQPLAIDGLWLATSKFHHDDRGSFREWFRSDELSAKTGLQFSTVQANLSVSNKGVLRGIHYSLARDGQAKWVSCMAGTIWDVVVDLRPSSPTFRQSVSVELSSARGESLVISAGLGHAFLSLENDSVVSYLVTSKYSPQDEYSIHPFDSELAIQWPKQEYVLSAQDVGAPTLLEAFTRGTLPK
jgi:dTDP-4-dehydrorhamnose 3,5-epimerase